MALLSWMEAWWQRVGLHYPAEVEALFSWQQIAEIHAMWNARAARSSQASAEAAAQARLRAALGQR